MAFPSFDRGGNGIPLHFLHANGYPPDCYRPLFDLLKPSFRVFGMKLRPLWPASRPEEVDDWTPFTDDFLGYLGETASGPLLAAGHSLGGIVTLRAAQREPQRFRGIVLLDPVLFPPHFIVFWRILRVLGLGHRLHPLIPGALKRRRQFENMETIFRAYRQRDVFRNLSDAGLRAYIAGILRPREGGGYELFYPPEWEARVYYTGVAADLDLWRNLKELRVPTLIIHGAQSDTFWAGAAARVRRVQPKVRVEAIEGAGHLVPLERPQEVAELISSFHQSL